MGEREGIEVSARGGAAATPPLGRSNVPSSSSYGNDHHHQREVGSDDASTDFDMASAEWSDTASDADGGEGGGHSVDSSTTGIEGSRGGAISVTAAGGGESGRRGGVGQRRKIQGYELNTGNDGSRQGTDMSTGSISDGAVVSTPGVDGEVSASAVAVAVTGEVQVEGKGDVDRRENLSTDLESLSVFSSYEDVGDNDSDNDGDDDDDDDDTDGECDGDLDSEDGEDDDDAEDPLEPIPGEVKLVPSMFPDRPPTVFFEYPKELGMARFDNDYYSEPLGGRRLLFKTHWERNSVKNAFFQAGFSRTQSNVTWTASWGKHPTREGFRALNRFQKVNHFPGSWCIGRKDRLMRTLARHKRELNGAASLAAAASAAAAAGRGGGVGAGAGAGSTTAEGIGRGGGGGGGDGVASNPLEFSPDGFVLPADR